MILVTLGEAGNRKNVNPNGRQQRNGVQYINKIPFKMVVPENEKRDRFRVNPLASTYTHTLVR